MNTPVFRRPVWTPLILATCLALLTQGAASAAVVSASFDLGPQSWSAAGNAGGPLAWQPAGQVSIEDRADGWAYFAAPAAFLNAMQPGAVLEFDLRHRSDEQHPAVSPVRVALVGAGYTLVAEHQRPTIEWSSQRFVFNPSDNWRLLSSAADAFDDAAPRPDAELWRQVLAHLSSLYISADYSAANALRGGFEISELDNVRLSYEPIHPLKTPGTLALTAAGLLFCIRKGRRR